MVARNLLFFSVTSHKNRKASGADRTKIVHFPLSAALTDTLVCRTEPTGKHSGQIVYHAHKEDTDQNTKRTCAPSTQV